MKKSGLEIYALAVCYTAIIAITACLSLGIWSGVKIAVPSISIDSYQYWRFQSNENYLRDNAEDMSALSSPEITRRRTEEYRLAVNRERRDTFQNLVQQLIVLLMSSAVFLIHWRLARKMRRKAEADS